VRLIGLTGGIASGKSTVSAMLRDLGATIIDADQLARDVVAKGQPALAEISDRFPGVLTAAGELDRAALGERVFADAAERAALNAILHPRIHQAFLDRVEALRRAGAKVAVYDVPLLYENGLEALMDGVVVAYTPPEVQRARLMARGGLTPAQADARISSQLPLEDKRARATWVIDNGGALPSTKAQVAALWEELSRPTSN
jgi:dephospho-CoA kinase